MQDPRLSSNFFTLGKALRSSLLVLSALAFLAACATDDPQNPGSGGAAGASGSGVSGTSGAGAAGESGAGGGLGALAACGPAASGAALAGIVPNPIVSRDKPVFASTGVATAVNDGQYRGTVWSAGKPSAASPAWVAIEVGPGYERLLLNWTASANYNYTDTQYGAPSDYQIEISPDSTNGADGTWTEVANVTGNAVRTRAHSFDFTGQSWVKFSISGAPAVSNGVAIDEIDVHDISNGSEDTWFFLGDSITAFAYDRAAADQPSFAERIHSSHPAYFPAMINGGIGGELTDQGLARLDGVLAQNPDFHFFAITYGTNDSWGNHTDTNGYKANLQSIIDKIVAAGAVPVLSHVPYSADGNHETLALYDQAIDELITSNQLPAGPDFCSYFFDHTDELMTDEVHPLAAGRVSMNRLWSEAADGAYTQ